MDQSDATLTRWRAHAAREELTEWLVTAVGALLAEHPDPCPDSMSVVGCICDSANWGEMAFLYKRVADGGE